MDFFIDDISHQSEHTARQGVGAHQHRNDGTVMHAYTQCRTDLILGKCIAAEVSLHELLAGLGNRLQQSLTADLQILLGVIRNIELIYGTLVIPALCLLLDNIYVTNELLILTDRKVERCDMLSVQLLQRLNYFTEAGLVVVHFRNKEHTREFTLLTEIPCTLCSYLDS